MRESRWDPSEDEVRNPEPYNYEGAKRAIAHASRDMAAAERARRESVEEYAAAEERYRMALAKEIIRVRDEDGAAWTVAQDLARGAKHVAELRRKRDIAQGVKDVAEQAAWKHTANRRSLEQLVAWSMRVAPDGQHQDEENIQRSAIGAAA